MNKICAQELCTGCLACYSICPAEAVIIADEQGFYKPYIDNAHCISCGKCRRVCPANNALAEKLCVKKIFACYVKNEEIRYNSSSGGFFSQVAADCLAAGGTVFGAGFDERMQIRHLGITNIEELANLRGSKYVQSFIGKTFKHTRLLLEQGKKVLYSGTPCQIAGLNNYLAHTRRDNLLLIDLVCHGVPSMQLYRDYLAYLRGKYQAEIIKVNFRYKPNGWKSFGMKVDFADGQIYFRDLFDDPYLIGFLKNYFLNPACYTCQYANTNRTGDLTIADFWGYRNNEKMVDDDKGITLVLANTEKGLASYEKVAVQLAATEKTLDEAIAGNASLAQPTFKNKRYAEFWQDYAHNDFSFLIRKYFAPRKRPSN